MDRIRGGLWKWGAPQVRKYDVLIIGGGIIGGMTARLLSRYRLRVLVIDQASDLGEGATKANSGILYAGFHPRGGSLKGISCVQGNAMYDTLCDELGVDMKRVGSLFVAFHPEGQDKLREKQKKGLKNGTPGMEIISGEEARRREPLLSERVVEALYAPTTAIISPFQLIWAVSLSAWKNGVEFQLNTRLTGLTPLNGGFVAHTDRGDIEADYVVNAAGGYADVVEGWLRPQDLEIRPRRGEYYVFDKQRGAEVRHVIYQAQESDEGGTLIAPTVDGNLLAGPTSQNVASFQRRETSREGLAHVQRVAEKLLPGLDMGEVITNFAGVRANITNIEKERKDFVVRSAWPHLVSALGIKNPGMTAAPYLAQMIVEQLKEQGLPVEERADYVPQIRLPRPFLQETPQRQEELYQEDKCNARVICRCEGITEGDVLRVLRGPLPPHSLSGLKMRLRMGMGRCQGGFCTTRLLELLAREWGCQPWEIHKYEKNSNVVKGRVK